MQERFDFWEQLYALVVKWTPIVILGFFTSLLGVMMQFKRGKITTKKEALWAFIISFISSLIVYYVASLRFDAFLSNALSVGTALFGKEALQFIFMNWDSILTGIFGKAGVKIRKRK